MPDVRFAIVGSGFAGLGMAIRLLRAGYRDLVVLERAGDVGGTWRDNTYPGCACDVPSHLYSFSFAPNPDWSRRFSPQPEIQDYLRRVADRFGVRRHLRLGTELLDAAWDDAAQRWRLRTSRGALTAQVLVVGAGPLSEPAQPDLPGRPGFAGPAFHSARWEDHHDLRGRRVAVVGTGASAAQFVPRLQPAVARLTLYQRTPPWVLPRRDRPITGLERAAFRRLPALQRVARGGVYATREPAVYAFLGNRRLQRLLEWRASRHLHRQVRDPRLRARLTPGYRLGCKRVLLSDDFYPALTRPNVEVVTEPVDALRPRAVRTADGTERPADVLVFATGFHVVDGPVAGRLRGRDGRTLAEHWQGSPQAYLGTSVAGFPNLFLLVGPNTGLGHNSIVCMIEAQVRYVLGAVRHLDAHGLASLDVRPAVQAAFNAGVHARMAGTVWTAGGCASWYLGPDGRNSTLWPGPTWRFRQVTATFDPAAYELRAPRG